MASRTKGESQARVSCKAAGCMRSFKSEQAMLQHFGDIHKVEQSSSMNHKKVPSSSSLTPLKTLACSECGAMFREHRALHQHQLSSPNHRKVSGPRDGSKHFSCNQCKAVFESSAYLDQHYLVKHPVVSLRRDDPERAEVLSNFIRKWSHPGSRPIVMDVLRVYNPGHRAKRFYQHRDKLIASRGSTDERIRRDGNSVVRYHGTTVLCGLGTGQDSLCSNSACSLCSIIQTGFKKKFADVRGFLRFGLGIYLTATSSKANDYVKAYSSGAPVGRRSMLVCRVLAGKTFKVTENMPELVAPPNGYDSVCGEVGGSLNYDELVVYDNAAILPDYIIIYDLK